MGKILPVCIICKQVPAAGIGGGIFIRKKFLCLDCEKEIAAPRHDAERYAVMVSGLRLIWRKA
ncbi:MAG: sigma factor G inhibitor Gin [Clostridiales bacterium]|nr:sigma factor G inhibitor Gin [Clostridiales bacterium]